MGGSSGKNHLLQRSTADNLNKIRVIDHEKNDRTGNK